VKHHGTESKYIEEILLRHRKEMSEIRQETKAAGIKFVQLKQVYMFSHHLFHSFLLIRAI
jgi:hypothetical protein